jgi:hypothetical protein
MSLWLSFFLTGDGTGDGGPPQYRTRKSGMSEKEASSDIPSWAKGERPFVGENGREFAERLLDAKYGLGTYRRGPGSEFSALQKFADRAFE